MYEIAFAQPLATVPPDMRAKLELRLRNIAASLAAIGRMETEAAAYTVVLVIEAWRFQYRVEPQERRVVVEEALFLGTV